LMETVAAVLAGTEKPFVLVSSTDQMMVSESSSVVDDIRCVDVMIY